MANRIEIKVEYWNDDDLLSLHSSAIDTTNTTLTQTCRLVTETFRHDLANVLTDLLTK